MKKIIPLVLLILIIAYLTGCENSRQPNANQNFSDSEDQRIMIEDALENDNKPLNDIPKNEEETEPSVVLEDIPLPDVSNEQTTTDEFSNNDLVKYSTSIERLNEINKDMGFELKYPEGLSVLEGGIECAGVQDISDGKNDMKFIVFSACYPLNPGNDISTYTIEEQYDKFVNSFIGEKIEKEYNGIKMTLINYSEAGDNGIYTLDTPPGTAAIWQNGDHGFALIDGGNNYQENGLFDEILASFKFIK